MKFRSVSFEKSPVVAILTGKLGIILQEELIFLRIYLGRPLSLINRQIPGMLTPLTLIDQPDIDAVAVGVHPELSGIDKLLLFAAASAPMEYFNCITAHVLLNFPDS